MSSLNRAFHYLLAFVILGFFVISIFHLRQQFMQKEEENIELPTSAFDSLTRECEIDSQGFGTCSYSTTELDILLDIHWSENGVELNVLEPGKPEGLFYIPFDGIEYTLVRIEGEVFSDGHEFSFNSGCIPIVAGKRFYKNYQDNQSEYLDRGRNFYEERDAFISPINGFIYDDQFECREQSMATQ